MKLKSAISFLLLFLINNSCKQVYEVDSSKPANEGAPFHVFFINRSLDDNLGVIVTDTNKREINFFYGDKNSQGNLMDIQQIVTYVPEFNLILDFELDENMLPKRFMSSRNDSITVIDFKNYDLKANTVDIDIFDTQNTLVQSQSKVWCGDAILKFKEAKGEFDKNKGLRMAKTDVVIDCVPFLNSLITASNGISCYLGLLTLRGSSIFTRLTGVGAAVFEYNLLFTESNCLSAAEGIDAIFNGECLPEDDLLAALSTKADCGQLLPEMFLASLKKGRNPFAILLTVLNKNNGRQCIADLVGDLGKWWNEYLHPELPDVPNFSSSPPDYYQGGRSFGDPNIVTFDGKSYSFNGVGEFVAVKSSVDNFEIQVRQEELKSRNGSGSISWNTGLAMNTGSDKLCFYPGKYYINGTQYAYSSSINNTLQNGGSVTGNLSELRVNVNGDIVKVFNRKDAIDYSVVPSGRRQGKMIGIFGDFNEDDKNDVRIRNGNIIDGSYNTLYPTFTDSWRINQAQSLFVYDSGKNSASYTDRNFPRVPLVITASQRASAEQVCKNAGVRAPFLEGCINDVVATGDVSFAQQAKELQDESTIRSFDIKLGPNDDKSLLTSQINSGNYGTDYLLCGTGTVSPEIQRPVSIINGFETTIYMASEIPDPQKSILASSLSLHFLSGLTWTVSGGSNYNYYDPILNFQTSLDPKIFVFDGKIHKVTIQSSIDLATKLSSYKLLVDDAIILEKKDFTIRAFNVQNKLPFSSGLSLTFGAASGAPNVKLYRWSFKSY